MINKIKGLLYYFLGIILLYFFPETFWRAKAGEVAPPLPQPNIAQKREEYYFESKRSLGFERQKVVETNSKQISVPSSQQIREHAPEFHSDDNDLSATSISFTASSFEIEAPQKGKKIGPKKILTGRQDQNQTVQKQTNQILVKIEKPIFPSVGSDSKTSVIEFFNKLSVKDFLSLFFTIKLFYPTIIPFSSPFDKSILSHFLEKVPKPVNLDLTIKNNLIPNFKTEAGHFDFFVCLDLINRLTDKQTVKILIDAITKAAQGIIADSRPRILPHTTQIERSSRPYGPIPASVRLEWRSHVNRPEFYRRLISKPTVDTLPKQIAEGAGIYFQGEILENGLVAGYIGKSITSLGTRTGVELTAIEKDLKDLFRSWFNHRSFFNTERGKQILKGLKDRFLTRLTENRFRPTRCHSVRWFMVAISRFPQQFETGQGNFLSYPAFFRKKIEVPNLTMDSILQDIVLRAYETFAIREFITHQTIFRRKLPYLTNGLVPEGALVLLVNETQLSPCRPIPPSLLKDFICLSREEVSNLIINYGWTWEKTAILYDPNLGIESIEDFKRELLRLRLPEILPRR